MSTPGLIQAMVQNSGGGDTTATASPSPVAPVQPGDLAQPVNTLPAAAPSIPTQPTDQSLEDLRKQSFGSKLYHGVMNALGGSQDVTFDRDETGKMVAHTTPSTPGMQWKRIISGALTGFVGGEEAGTQGPGGTMRGLAGGIRAGTQARAAEEKNLRGEADEDYKTKLDTATGNLRNALLQHEIIKSSFDLQNMQDQAQDHNIALFNEFHQAMNDGGEDSQIIGTFDTPQEAMKYGVDHPEIMKHDAGGMLRAMPNFVNGKRKGIVAAVITPAFLNKPSTREYHLPIKETVPGEDGKPTTKISSFDIPIGTPMGNVVTMMGALSKEFDTSEYHDAMAAAAGVRAAAATDAAHAANTRATAAVIAATDRDEAKKLNTASDNATIQSNAQQLVEGSIDPSNLSKRGKTYDPTLAAANAYSMAKYGKPFDVAKAAGDYKFATNVGTYNTLNYLNSLTGRDNQSGNLTSVVNLSDKLSRSDFPPINAVDQWAKLSAGHDDVAAYRAGLLEVSDQIAKILQGGGTGNATSDSKLKDAQGLLDKNFNSRQIRSVALELRELLANRKKEIIGDNRYLMQWHGAAAAPGGGAAPPPTAWTPPAGAPPAPQQDNKYLYDSQKRPVAKSLGGKWVQP
jgi:hypothetical protein